MTKFFITLATLTLFIVSCKRMQKSPGGLEYQIFNSNSGAKIGPGDLVFFKVVAKAGDSVLYDTYKNHRAPYMNMQISETFSKGNFEEGLTMLAKDDSALFKINADSFYKVYVNSPTPPFIKSGTLIDFYVKIDSVITKKGQEERKAQADLELMEKQKAEGGTIDAYIASSGIKYTKTASGLYYNITKTSSGAKASTGDKVGTNYTGKLFSGKVFDSNIEEGKPGKPFEFELGSHQVIAGWDEIFAILRVGEQATIVIPSALAYGPQGAGADIGPYTPLIFDVELLSITKAKK